GFSTPAHRFVATNTTLRELIAWAYGDPGPPPEPRGGFQMSGGQGWIAADRFDIEATTGDLPDGVEKTRLEMRMLQKLLADRFKLWARQETGGGPFSSLVGANGGARLGPRLQRSDVDCNASSPQPPRQVPPCEILVGLSVLSIGTQSLPAMARLFSRAVGRPVV